MEEEILKFNSKPNKPLNWDMSSISEKIEALSKMIALECSKQQRITGGREYKFIVNDITSKETNESLGNVTITWELNNEN